MLKQISLQSKQDFEAAAEKLGLSKELPDFTKLRPDLGLYLTAHYMLAVIIEAGKDGQLHDITDHDVRKYEPWFEADDKYQAGTDGLGFRLHDVFVRCTFSSVGSRLCFNGRQIGRETVQRNMDLWEIIMLNVQ